MTTLQSWNREFVWPDTSLETALQVVDIGRKVTLRVNVTTQQHMAPVNVKLSGAASERNHIKKSYGQDRTSREKQPDASSSEVRGK
jgi:hypothetical protein